MSAGVTGRRARGRSRCRRTHATPTSLAPSSWLAVPADPSVRRGTRRRRPDQGDAPYYHLNNAAPVPVVPAVGARRALVVEGDAAMAPGHPSPVREYAPVVPGCGYRASD
jgi:hypothetical protein